MTSHGFGLCLTDPAVSRLVQPRVPEIDDYQALPADDVEAAGSAGSDTPAPRTWATLFVDACAYAWPESLGLRMRVLACVGLLLLMRVINLAVPISYKRLVDQLAAATSAAPGHRPGFWELLKPW
jgi:hypothetical protein